MNYINYITAGSKVLYDKTKDYLNYTTYNNNGDSNNITNDKLDDYNSVIQVELYEKEGNNGKRIFPSNSYYDEYTTFFKEPTHIIDNIYLGSAYNAASYDTLKRLDIRVIMNATNEISNYYPDDFVYNRYKLYDNNKNSIKQYLEKSYNDIIQYQDKYNGNILVHCFMGSSRSASIILYYLMKRMENKSFDEVLIFLKKKRLIVNPTFRLTKDLAQSII